MGLLNQAHKAALTDGGHSVMNQLANINPQGPIAYTTYDLLKHFAWAISILKFVAHVCSLPLAVFLRRDFGLRYVDEIHIALAFVLWQIAGTFTVGVTADDLVSTGIGLMINLVGLAFLPTAIFHRFRAKSAAIQGKGYSYYPGSPWGFWAKLPRFLVGALFRSLDYLAWRIAPERYRSSAPMPRKLTHPTFVLDPDRIQGLVRRFGEPLLIIFVGLLIAATGANTLFAVFLIWTGLMLYVAETFTQREGWEVFLDQLDAGVIAQEKERMLNEGPEGLSLTHGVSLARVADPREVLSKIQRGYRDAKSSSPESDHDAKPRTS